MAKPWLKLASLTPLMLGIVLSVLNIVAIPEVLAQIEPSNPNNPNSQQIEAQRLYEEGVRLRREGTREFLLQSLEKFQQALALFRSMGYREREARTLNDLGLVSSILGQSQQSLSYYQRALEVTRELGDSIEERFRQREIEAATLNNIGVVYGKIGQPQQALNYYQQSLPLLREVGDRRGETIALNSIGVLYSSIGQPQLALNYYQQALPITREEGQAQSSAGEATILVNIGGVYHSLGEPQQAISHYQQALPIFRRINYRSGEANTLNYLGNIYSTLGQPQQALSYYQPSLSIWQDVGDRAGEARVLTSIGAVYRDLGQLPQALTFLQQALPLRIEVGDRPGEANTLYNLASVKKNLNNLPDALQDIQTAIKIVEEIRGQLINPDNRTSYFATVQSYYKLQIDLLMQLHQQKPSQGYDIQAFNLTERSKARTLLELLTESKADIRTGVAPQLLAQEKDIQNQLSALDKRRIELANAINNPALSEQIAILDKQRETLQTQYRDLQTQIRSTSPKYAALKYPQPLTLEQIQQQILDEDTIILSYSLDQERSYLWLVTKTGLTSYQLPNKKIIEDLVNKKVRPQLTNPRTNRNSFVANTVELSAILLKPVLEKIGNKRIVIIGDGALQYIPFGVLPDPRKSEYEPLVVNNEIVYLPSASTLQTIRNETQNRPPAPKTLAVLADPVFSRSDQRVSRSPNSPANPQTNTELPLAAQNLDRAARNARGEWDRLTGTRQEANAILNLVPENNRLGFFDFQANRENAQGNQLSQYRFIHWATHGFANPQKPELSGMVMSLVTQNGQQENGYLLLGDIFNLSFNADLVVLSACQTGLGEVVQGEGLVGLTRGFMYAGTPRVVTSLWEVPDAETADLMSKFYIKMLQQNLRPAEALRAAQLEMFRSRNWIAPYFWGAFTLQGEWR